MRTPAFILVAFAISAAGASAADRRGHLETEDLPAHLRDRGAGIATSMFATYVQEGQLLVYPFVELYRDSDYEYKPAELGYDEDVDYRGRYTASEELLFLAYGVSDRLAIEMEAAIIQAKLEKSAEDGSGVPDEIKESGLGDVEGQLRWRWAGETNGSPEIFSYLETVFPTQEEGSLIGTSDWEFKFGTGVMRGFSWGTMALRAAVEHDRGEGETDIGELAVEYVKRLSPSWRVYAGAEGTQDEWEMITEVQWHLAPQIFVKLNNAFGLTSKATDWAPEFGVMFGF